MHDVEIRTQNPFTVAAVDHAGAYMQIGRSFSTLYDWTVEHGLLNPQARSIAIYYDDPTTVPQAQLRSKACVEITEPEQVVFDGKVSRLEVAGGEFAVFTYIGPYSQLESAYRWLYREWLPTSEREAAQAPVYEVYLNNCRDTPPMQLMTEICLPLKS